MHKCKSILLIDDDDIENLINKKLINRLSAAESVTTLSNGLEGIKYIQSLSIDSLPDLVFVDINMPVMDGFGFLTEYRKLPEDWRKKMRVIVLTSSISQDDNLKAVSIGCDGFLNKPLTKEAIFEEIGKV